MTRSQKIMQIIEGFRLGSLGVGSKKPVISAPHTEPKIQEPQQKVWKFDRLGPYALIWTQHLDRETINKLKLYNAQEDSDLTFNLTGDQNFSSDSSNYIPTLNVLKDWKGMRSRKSTFVAKKTSFRTNKDFIVWLNKTEDYVKENGLDIEGFTKFWQLSVST